MKLSLLRSWQAKGAVAFTLPTIAEIRQYFDIEVLGRTFDPTDILMYGMGTASAIIVETQVLSRCFRFWNDEPKGARDHQLLPDCLKK